MLLLSNSQLKEELRKQNLSTNGNKSVLVQRLLTMITAVAAQPTAPEPAAISNEAPSNQPTEVMTEQQLMQISNAALKDLLKEKDLSTNGSKAVMVQRILTGVPRARAVPRNRNPLLAEEEEVEGLTGFPRTAMWKELSPAEEAVREPTMPELRAPTVPQGKDSMPKFNFEETFDRQPSTEQCQVYTEVNGTLVMDRRRNHVMETEIRTEGRAKVEWLKNK